jgi:hypothetical protein
VEDPDAEVSLKVDEVQCAAESGQNPATGLVVSTGQSHGYPSGLIPADEKPSGRSIAASEIHDIGTERAQLPAVAAADRDLVEILAHDFAPFRCPGASDRRSGRGKPFGFRTTLSGRRR